MRKSSKTKSQKARVIGLPFDTQLQFEQPLDLTGKSVVTKSVLLICDQVPPSAELLQSLRKIFDLQLVVDPISGLLAMQAHAFDLVAIVLESVQSNLWVMLRSLSSKSKQSPLPLLLFAPGMDANQMQKAYGLGVLFCCNRQLDARDISNQLNAFANFHERLKQNLLNKAGLHHGLLRTPDEEHEFLAELNEHIHAKYVDPELSIHQLAKAMKISISTLERKCLQLTGMRPRAYLNEHRLLCAYQYIANANCNIQEASKKSGFANASYFSVKFSARFKMKPSDLMRQDSRIA